MNTQKKSGWMIAAMLTMIVLGCMLCTTNMNYDKALAAQTIYSTTNLNIRDKASTDGTIVTTIPSGTAMEVIEILVGWYGVTCSYNNTSYTGYVSSSYVTTVAPATPTAPAVTASPEPSITPIPVYVSKVTYKANPIPAKVTSSIRTRKTAGGKLYKLAKSQVSVKKKQSVKIYGQKIYNKQVWYRIRFTFWNKKRYAYVPADYVKMTLKTKVPAKVYNTSSVVMKKSPGGANYKVAGEEVSLKKKTSVKIVKETTKAGKKWFQVSFSWNGATKKAYVLAKYICPKKKKITTKTLITVALTDKEFEAEMVRQGFPDSYKPLLRVIHKKYPFWQFQAMKTGLDWSAALARETVLGVNLIPNYKTAGWKSQDPKTYNSATNTYKVYDGSTWVAASEAAVAYYMDPRNFITVQGIFQFELLSYQSVYQTESGVANVLLNTPFSGNSFSYTESGKTRKLSYAKAFVEAAAQSGVSPYHLVSRMKQEVITGANSTSIAVTGSTSQYPGIFNFYNIGATHATTYSPALNGLKWASAGTTYMRPWNNQYRSIVGGGIYIGNNYINRGQNTIYLEKFNVTSNNTYGHQYMANVEVGNAEAVKTKNAYGGLLDSAPIIFSIPIYENMPASVCKAPQ